MADNLEKRITAKVVMDDSGYSATQAGLNAKIKETKSAFKSASEGVKAFGKSVEGLKAQQNALTEQLSAQKSQVDIYKQSISKVNSKMQENIRIRDELKSKLNENKQAMERVIQSSSKELEQYKKNESALQRLNSSYDKAKTKYGENSQECDRLKNAITTLEQKQQSLISSNNQEISSYQKVKSELEQVKKAYEDKDKAVLNNAKTIQNYETRMNNANSEMNRTQSQLNNVNRDLNNQTNKWNLASQSLNTHSKKLKKVADGCNEVGDGFLRAGIPLAAVGALVVKTGNDYDSEMSRVKSISGSTKEEFKELEDQSLKLGASSCFSAKQVAQAQESEASAGLKINEILKATPGILDAAASSGEDLATSSDIITSSLRGFGLEAEQAGHVADVLAKNAADTNAAMTDTGFAMKYVAPVAHAAGLSLEEVTASIGLLSNAGIKGSQAGTTLRGALTRLANPSKEAASQMKAIGFNAFDANGKMLPLNKMIGNLQKSLTGLSDKQKQAAISTIFGQEAMSGMLVLADAGSDKLNKLTNSLKNSDGAAQDMATTMQDNGKSAVEQMMGSMETAAIKIEHSVAPAIKSVCDTVGNLADKFAELSPATQSFIMKAIVGTVAVGGLAKGLGGIIGTAATTAKGLGKLAGFIGKISGVAPVAATAVQAVGTSATVAAGGATVATGALGGLGAAIASVALPAILIGGAIASVGYGAYKLYKYLHSSATPAVDLFADKVEKSGQRIVHANGRVTVSNKETVTKISEGTKKAVGSYLELDKKASNSLMSLRANSDRFSKETKDKVIKNFADMSKNSDKNSNEMKDKMVTNFKNLVKETGTLTEKNKTAILQKYTEMVNGCSKLSEQQKKDTIQHFKETLQETEGVTKDEATNLEKIYADMGTKIKQGMDKNCNDELKTQEDFFANSSALSTKEEAEVMQKTKEHYEEKKKTVDNAQQKINEILQNAANEHRNITDAEAKAIESYQQDMKTTAVKTLSEQKEEAAVILQRMKDQDGHITAEQASQHIQELNKQRDESVKAANDEYDKRIKEITQMRDESKVISADQAEKLIADAKKTRDDSVAAAEDTRKQAVDKITSMNSDISKNVDTTTGKVLNWLDKLKSWWDGWNPQPKTLQVMTVEQAGSYHLDTDGRGHLQEHWNGTTNFSGGYTHLHERGDEILELPTSTKIYTAYQSDLMLKQLADNLAEGYLNNANKGINVTQNIYSPVSSEYEIARQTKNNLRELMLCY